MNTETPNPFVFIVGCPRSGTTLLQRIADAHPRIAVIHEYRWLIRWYKKRVGLTPEGLVTPRLVDQMLEDRKYTRRLKIEREQLEGLLRGADQLSYSRFFSALFDLYGRARGKELVGEKNPEDVLELPTLHELWPQARFVHLMRDGRDVCLSFMNWKLEKKPVYVSNFVPWEQDPVSTAAALWVWHVRLGREDGGALGPGLYHELRYESLVAHPEETCRNLCAFLGLTYDPAMLCFHEGHTRDEPNLDAKAAWRPITGGLRDWRTQMPAEALEKFEAIAGDLLEELGYVRSVPKPRREVLEHTARMRDRFTEDLKRRKLTLPKQW